VITVAAVRRLTVLQIVSVNGLFLFTRTVEMLSTSIFLASRFGIQLF
jgi:hypothetical protein